MFATHYTFMFNVWFTPHAFPQKTTSHPQYFDKTATYREVSYSKPTQLLSKFNIYCT